MDFSPLGRAALEGREGCKLLAYRDSVGTLTIGYGHTTAAGTLVVKAGMLITQDDADRLFAIDVEKYVAAVRAALVKPVPQPFFDGCCSLCYNIGPVGFAHSSVARLANAGELGKAAEAFLMWNKPASIVSRRQGERDQAALASYSGAKVYARRGDRAPVKAPAGAPPAPAPKVPDPLAPMTRAPAAPAPAPAPAPAAGGLFGLILRRLRAAYPSQKA